MGTKNEVGIKVNTDARVNETHSTTAVVSSGSILWLAMTVCETEGDMAKTYNSYG